MEYLKIEDIKPNDYIVVEIGRWNDDNDDTHEDGICYGHVTKFVKGKYDKEIDQKIDVFECDMGIYADGKCFLNNELGTAPGNKYRYMTQEEITMFNNKFNIKDVTNY